MTAPPPSQPHPLKKALEALCVRYEHDAALTMDPLACVREYQDPLDREVAAWVAAHLAYGRVAPMLKAIRKALSPLGAHPALWLRNQDPASITEGLQDQLQGWVWRFHTRDDLILWLLAWKRMDASTGQGVEPLLCPGPEETAEARLSAFIRALRLDLPETPGLRFNLPDPAMGAACKRWRMFLRWMVRSGWPDLGCWRQYPAPSLVIPLDTHVMRTAHLIGLTNRKTPDGRTAREITEKLQLLDAQDPLRYDFAISHLGIMGDCLGRRSDTLCPSCPLTRDCTSR